MNNLFIVCGKYAEKIKDGQPSIISIELPVPLNKFLQLPVEFCKKQPKNVIFSIVSIQACHKQSRRNGAPRNHFADLQSPYQIALET